MEVSIIIPVYNRVELVKATLESVRRQTYRPLHLMLVDNNSTDNTLQVLQEFKNENISEDFLIDVIKESKEGACAARNAGARLVTSEWLMFFDSDDTMEDCLVEKYVEKIQQEKDEVDIVCTKVDLNVNGKISTPYFAEKDFLVNHIFHSVLSTQRYIMKKSLFDSVGGWNEDVKCWNDWELGIRLLLQEPKVVCLDEGVYVHVNVHPDSITGAGYSYGHERREFAITVARQDVLRSSFKGKERILKLLSMRSIVLAGLYKKEKRKDLAETLYASACKSCGGYKILRLLAPVIYRYVGMGGRGITELIKMLIR